MLVDNHPVVGYGLKMLFQSTDDLELAGQATSVADAMVLLKAGIPDLVLLGLSLPGPGGIEFLKNLQISHPSLPVLVFSMYDENDFAKHVLQAGGKGYVMKCESCDEVLVAVRCVLAGGVFVSPNLAARLVASLVPGAGAVPKGKSVDTLNCRELQVYSMIGNGMTTQKIAKNLNISPKTVQTYREHIKQKMGLRTATDLVHSATLWLRNQCGG
jgi:DNA-binding NarL/FixJ family response regulator